MSEIIENVRAFMTRELRIKDANTLASDFALIKRGILDSIELMQLVSFIESSYGIAVLDTEILPENLGTLDQIEAFVRRKSATAGAPR